MNASSVLGSLAELGKREARPTWLAIGMFDGVHLGHRAVLNLAAEEARKANDLVAALTFPEHPAKFLRPGKEPPLLMNPKAKSEALLACGVNWVVMKPFDESLSGISSQEFPGYLKEPCGTACETQTSVSDDLVQMVTDQVLAALQKAS